VRCVVHVARMEVTNNLYNKILFENLKGREQWEDSGFDEKVLNAS
jgi:hypothetical protein